jgi:hypothetical protein
MDESLKMTNTNPNPQVPDFFDKFFIVVTAFGFGLGTAIALLPNVVPLPIVPSIFFGTGIGALVYRFMGGFRDTDSLQTKTFKISGSLASLLSSIVVINLSLDAQYKIYLAEHLYLKKGENGYIDVKIREFSLGKLKREDFNNEGYYSINDVSIVDALSMLKLTSEGYNHPVLLKLRNDCARNQGICEPNRKEFNLTIYSIKPEAELAEGKAIGCLNSDSFWIGNEELLIYKSSGGKGSKISIEGFDECVDKEGQDKEIIISEKDAKKLNANPQEKIKAIFR